MPFKGDPDHTKMNRDLGAIDWSRVREEKGPNGQKTSPPFLFVILPAWEGAHLGHRSQKTGVI